MGTKAISPARTCSRSVLVEMQSSRAARAAFHKRVSGVLSLAGSMASSHGAAGLVRPRLGLWWMVTRPAREGWVAPCGWPVANWLGRYGRFECLCERRLKLDMQVTDGF
jgi:hypothetical protein